MSRTPWFRHSHDVLRRQQDRLVAEWFSREVPFSSWWRGLVVDPPTDVASLGELAVSLEAEVASAGGPGNPSLLLSPTEAQFKSRARVGEVFAAARSAARGGGAGRRDAIWHRYKPVHIHEAGVDRLIAIAYSRSDLDLLHLASARTAEVLGWGADDALVNLVAPQPSVRYWGLYHAALASRMTALHPRTAGESASSAARRGLRLLPASVIAVPVDEAAEVISAITGLALPNLRQVVTVGCPPDGITRTSLVEAASAAAGQPVTVQAAWAPEAGRFLYAESPPAVNDPPEATFGLLTQPDLEVLELRNADTGEMVTDGGPGELVITSAGWRGTALVRFATGTWVAGLESQTPHPVTGATVPRVAPHVIEGAWQPKVVTTAGNRRPDLRGTDHLIGEALARHGISDFRLAPVKDHLVLALPAAADADPAAIATAKKVARRVGEMAGVVPQVLFDDHLARRPSLIGRASGEVAGQG